MEIDFSVYIYVFKGLVKTEFIADERLEFKFLLVKTDYFLDFLD